MLKRKAAKRNCVASRFVWISFAIWASPWRTIINRDIRLTVFFAGGLESPPSPSVAEIDQSISIVVETAQNSNRANFPLKSKAGKFDGLTVGFRPSAENFCV
jgi:hypothetical protein